MATTLRPARSTAPARSSESARRFVPDGARVPGELDADMYLTPCGGLVRSPRCRTVSPRTFVLTRRKMHRPFRGGAPGRSGGQSAAIGSIVQRLHAKRDASTHRRTA